MYVANRGARWRALRGTQWLTAERIVPYSCAMLLLIALTLGAWAWTTRGFSADTAVRPGVDFAVFWTASDLILHGQVGSIYDFSFFTQAELLRFGAYLHHGFLPWLYPPTMLLLVVPLAFVPFLPAFFLFFAGSFLCYARGVAGLSGLRTHLAQPGAVTLALLAFPGVFVAIASGQNGLLTAGIAALALRHLERRPVAAGLLVSLLAIKPQLAVLFPLVLIATRAWRAFAAAAAGSALFAAASVALGGGAALRGFANGMTMVREMIVEYGVGYWLVSPSPFAALRLAGASPTLAYAAQAAIALVAATAAVAVWRRTRDMRLRGAALAAATLLTAPYLWHYELPWLGIAVFCVVAYGLDEGWLPGDQPVVVLAWLLPAFEFVNRLFLLPQIGPVVLLSLLFVVLRRASLAPGAA
ncbi:hypothetical protein WJ94_06805 [Burkholderia ubonensis]|uniref:glycosyltransferase family 87 protein n=1 Tax=Burkholderia ubonensis TaxID=101571 RepID=UPI00075A5198|nr:glycosyltransferase family 87 protein [Burkholderia ubonensis]KVP81969.1 hypothetical protein WJ94_06805 [Burkholderia ubonensis]KVQ12382.1 hypothetical protein WJ98_28505 [Burkholderia ubonensis]KVQ12657.1 hypothetical protein WJ98_29980 [Burkholderia ubonensis]KWI54617.1 hypothetical protein WM05_09250 [Burkholderia ubonensis]OJA84025.1 hypothetical protein BGV49_22660 [Burkholderia ubonensis]